MIGQGATSHLLLSVSLLIFLASILALSYSVIWGRVRRWQLYGLLTSFYGFILVFAFLLFAR